MTTDESEQSKSEMNPVLLTHWLSLCARCDVDAVPGRMGPSVPIDDLMTFATTFRMSSSVDRIRKWLLDNYNPKDSIWRWDCCSPISLKEQLREGSVHLPPPVFFEADDPRLPAALAIAEQHGAQEMNVLVRPWIRATIKDDVPVEFRAFAWPGGVAVTNYHRRRPLTKEFEEVARRVLDLTETLAHQTDQAAFSADFLLDCHGAILFLEGGLGYDGGRLVDGGCFDREPKAREIALSTPCAG